jgi:hypothetical protein
MTRSLFVLMALVVASSCTFGTFKSPEAPPITRSRPAQLKCGQLDSLSRIAPDSTPPVCVKSPRAA